MTITLEEVNELGLKIISTSDKKQLKVYRRDLMGMKIDLRATCPDRLQNYEYLLTRLLIDNYSLTSYILEESDEDFLQGEGSNFMEFVKMSLSINPTLTHSLMNVSPVLYYMLARVRKDGSNIPVESYTYISHKHIVTDIIYSLLQYTELGNISKATISLETVYKSIDVYERYPELIRLKELIHQIQGALLSERYSKEDVTNYIIQLLSTHYLNKSQLADVIYPTLMN